MSKYNAVDNLLKKAKNKLTSKPKTRSQTHDNELANTSLDQGNSMVTDTPDVGLYPHENILV